MKIYKCPKCHYERISREDFERSKPTLRENITPTYIKIDLKCPKCISIDKNGVEHDISVDSLL